MLAQLTIRYNYCKRAKVPHLYRYPPLFYLLLSLFCLPLPLFWMNLPLIRIFNKIYLCLSSKAVQQVNPLSRCIQKEVQCKQREIRSTQLEIQKKAGYSGRDAGPKRASIANCNKFSSFEIYIIQFEIDIFYIVLVVFYIVKQLNVTKLDKFE